MITVTTPFNRPAQVEKKEDRNQDRNNYRKNKDALKNKVVDLIKNNPTITIINSAKAVNDSKSTIERIIKSSENIKHIGSTKGGHWEIREIKKSRCVKRCGGFLMAGSTLYPLSHQQNLFALV